MEITFQELVSRAGFLANPTDPNGGIDFMNVSPGDTDPEAAYLLDLDNSNSDLIIWTFSDYGPDDDGKGVISAVPMFLPGEDFHIGHWVAANEVEGVDFVIIDRYSTCSECEGSGCQSCEDGHVFEKLNPGWRLLKA